MGDNKLLAVGWDLDSTLASTMHRRHLIPEIRAGRATWDEYSDLCPDDEPVAGAVALARMLHDAYHPQYAISGRSARAYDQTVAWLAKHDVPIDHVILRPEGDRTENQVFKMQILNQLRHQRGVEFGLFIEDWAPAAKFIAAYSAIPVLGVNPFDEGAVLVTQVQLAEALEKELGAHAAGQVAAAVFEKLGGAF
jgi:hypothetical protein